MRRYILVFAALTLALLLASICGVVLGISDTSPAEAVGILFASALAPASPATPEQTILLTLRIPRIGLGIGVGAVLSAAGVAMQSLLRNPLAEPYLLGISSGASFGAAASILFGIGAGFLGLGALAFLGALLALVFVFATVGRRGSFDGNRLILAGVAVSFMLGALTNFLVFISDNQGGARSVLFWTLGSLSRAQYPDAAIALTAGAILTGVCWLWARKFDVMAVSDDTALSLGVHPETFRKVAFVLVAAAVACAVSVAGAIGFIGLVVPHIVRRWVGTSHRLLFPASALAGATLTVVADLGARMLFSPQELPLGILTALVGTPLLVVLIRRLHRKGEK